MKKILSGMLTLLVLLSSCAQKEMVREDAVAESPKGSFVEPQTVVDGMNAFSFDIFHRMNASSGNNEFISPLSISSALAMTYAGAEGQTAAEMQKALQYGPQEAGFHQSYGAILDSLSKSNEDFEINIANAVWVQNDYPLLEKYLKTIRMDYRGESRELDFVKKPGKSRETINQWVEDRTNERIKDLIPNGVIDAETRMILTNAVYFNAEWAEKFNEKLTRKEPFYLLDGSESICDLMYQRHRYGYSETDDRKILEIPYKGYDYSMMIILPKANDGLKKLSDEFGPDMIAMHDQNKRWEDVLVYVPKFKLESDYELKPALSALGMELPFSDAADFSGMTGSKDLKISSVIHKTFIEVDEVKTEAAAATAVVMKLTSAMPSQIAPKEFRADHPFYFMIRHNESGAILFMGQITNPE